MKSYREDVVGSMLRPDYLMQTREQRAAGELSDAEFKRLEDRAVDETIAIQNCAGLHVLTDGVLRRDSFMSQLLQASDGFGTGTNNRLDWFDMVSKRHTSDLPCVEGKIKRNRY